MGSKVRQVVVYKVQDKIIKILDIIEQLERNSESAEIEKRVF